MAQGFHFYDVIDATVPAISAVNKAGRAVTFAGAVPAAGATCMGFLRSDVVIGDKDQTAQQGGWLTLEAGAAIAAGVDIELDAQGRAITRTAGRVVAYSMDTASAAGEYVLCHIRLGG